MGAMIRLKDVHAAYQREPVLTEVTAEVKPGERIAVVGPNGAGKSTLIKVLLGLVPHVVGYVEAVGERVVPGRPPSRVAYVPQSQVVGLEMPVTVWDVVAMGRIRKGRWGWRMSRQDRDAVEEALEAVGMIDKRHLLFGALSGGQRQRVLIARALVRQAPLLLLDEPSAGLDAPTEDLVESLMSRLQRNGVAMVQVTHDLGENRLRTFDRIWCINRRLVGEGSYDEILSRGILARTFGLPGGETRAVQEKGAVQ
ncbi:MAG: metal ABC transporter ATP-binding protein [Alicyclobacillaceae bacterium]|nr:metal ABC transporter ATP-binding protein [Alicyclobacillaceae bacterium]